MEKREKLVLFLSVGLILLAILLYNYLPDLVLGYRPHNANFIGLTTHASGDVQVRFGDSINWKKLQKNDGIYARSYLFTGANSSGSYAFLDESTINLEQNSLVYLNFHPTAKKTDENQSLSIDLLEGNVKLDLPKDSNIKSITMNDTTVEPGEQQTSLKLESGAKVEVMVMEGEINVTKEMVNVNVKAGEKLGIQKEGLPEKESIPKELMEEMKRIAENDRKALEEARTKREFSYVLSNIFSIFNFFGSGSEDEPSDGTPVKP